MQRCELGGRGGEQHAHGLRFTRADVFVACLFGLRDCDGWRTRLSATGATVTEVESKIREAITFHIEGMREDGIAIPPGTSQVEYVEVELAA